MYLSHVSIAIPKGSEQVAGGAGYLKQEKYVNNQ
jgi:hypothetical protein